MDAATQVYVIDYLMAVQPRQLHPEALDRFETSEFAFRVSPYDLLHNLIEIKRAKRAEILSRIGYPHHQNVSRDWVCSLEFPAVLLNYESGSAFRRTFISA